MSERTIKNRKRRKLLAENDLTEKEIKCRIHQLGNFEGKSGLVDLASELCCAYDGMHTDEACWNILADINDSLGVRWYLTDVYKGMKSIERINRERRICSDYMEWKKEREIKVEELKQVIEKEAAEREDEGEKDDKKREESEAEHELRKLSLSRYAFLNQVACPDAHLIHGHDISKKYFCSRAECQRILYALLKESPETEETKAESPETEETKAESPEAEGTKAESPEAEGAKAESPEAEGAKAESPEAEGVKAESPEAGEAKAESMKTEDADEEWIEDEGVVDLWGRLTNFEKYDQDTLERFVFDIAIAFLNEKLPDTLNVLLERINTGNDSKKGKKGPVFGEMDGVGIIEKLIGEMNKEIFRLKSKYISM